MGGSGASATQVVCALDKHTNIERKNNNKNAHSHLFLALLVARAIKTAVIDVVVAAADAFLQDRVYRHSSMAAAFDVLAPGLKDRICKAEHRHRRRLLLLGLRALESSFSVLSADGRLCVAAGRGGTIA